MKKIIITSLCVLACFASAIAQIGYRQDDITYSLNTDESGNNYACSTHIFHNKKSSAIELLTLVALDFTT